VDCNVDKARVGVQAAYVHRTRITTPGAFLAGTDALTAHTTLRLKFIFQMRERKLNFINKLFSKLAFLRTKF
jgi:2-methylcitrate dehydratase PrpD